MEAGEVVVEASGAEVVASTTAVVISAKMVGGEVVEGGVRGGRVAVGVKLPSKAGRSRAVGREKLSMPAIRYERAKYSNAVL